MSAWPRTPPIIPDPWLGDRVTAQEVVRETDATLAHVRKIFVKFMRDHGMPDPEGQAETRKVPEESWRKIRDEFLGFSNDEGAILRRYDGAADGARGYVIFKDGIQYKWLPFAHHVPPHLLGGMTIPFPFRG